MESKTTFRTITTTLTKGLEKTGEQLDKTFESLNETFKNLGKTFETLETDMLNQGAATQSSVVTEIEVYGDTKEIVLKEANLYAKEGYKLKGIKLTGEYYTGTLRKEDKVTC